MPSPKSQIKVLREKKGLTQRALANSWGVSEVTVQNWETDVGRAHTLSCFVLMCKALGCEPEELIDSMPITLSSSNIHDIRKQIRLAKNSNTDAALPTLRIAELRNKNGFTQKDLASVIEVSVNTIQNWENGRTSGNKIIKIIRLCGILECQYTELVIDIPEHQLDNVQALRAKKPILPHQKNQDINIITNQSRKKSDREHSRIVNSTPNNLSD